MRARNTHSSKARKLGETEDAEDEEDEEDEDEEEEEQRRSREWSVAGTACIHCQDNGFQEVYGGCARALPRTRQGEAHQFPIQFTRPVFRTLASTELPRLPTRLAARAATRGDRFRARQVFR